MKLLLNTELEVVSTYRQAPNKGKQIRILAELNGVTPKDIASVLIAHGEKLHPKTLASLGLTAPDTLCPSNVQESANNARTERTETQEAKADAGQGGGLYCLTSAIRFAKSCTTITGNRLYLLGVEHALAAISRYMEMVDQLEQEEKEAN